MADRHGRGATALPPTVKINTEIPKALHRAIIIHRADTGESMKTVVQEGVQMYLAAQKAGRKPTT